LNWIFLILILLSSIAITYQDFKYRLISVWVIVVFAMVSVGDYLYLNGPYQLLENGIMLLLYILLSYLSLVLFYYLKTRSFVKLIDNKIGLGDILLIMIIGLCLEPMTMIVFFTLTFFLSVVLQIALIRNKSVPLAGIVAISFTIYRVYLEF
jgi:hypothetical protein